MTIEGQLAVRIVDFIDDEIGRTIPLELIPQLIDDVEKMIRDDMQRRGLVDWMNDDQK